MPYKKPRSNLNENSLFNITLSSARAVIENAIGELKNRFSVLRGIPTQVRKVEDFRHIMRLCQAAVLLHNIAKLFQGDWEDVENMDPSERNQAPVFEAGGTAEHFRELRKGYILRNKYNIVN